MERGLTPAASAGGEQAPSWCGRPSTNAAWREEPAHPVRVQHSQVRPGEHDGFPQLDSVGGDCARRCGSFLRPTGNAHRPRERTGARVGSSQERHPVESGHCSAAPSCPASAKCSCKALDFAEGRRWIPAGWDRRMSEQAARIVYEAFAKRSRSVLSRAGSLDQGLPRGAKRRHASGSAPCSFGLTFAI